MKMTIAKSASELPRGVEIAFVPTMGALHAGHMVLVEAAKQRAANVCVSIFVNPAQFGPNEDFSRYPRTLEADIELCRAAGVSCVYVPDVAEIYPQGFDTSIRVGAHEHMLCGVFRPNHFTGVATVVAKLFHLVRPKVAVFGEKDFQQLTMIRQLVRDLNMGIEIVGVPTLREADGLALSSRNRYLDEADRAAAPRLYATLKELALGLRGGLVRIADVPEVGSALLRTRGFTKIDYVELRASDDLSPIENINQPARLLAAAWLGNTRLIDNIPL